MRSTFDVVANVADLFEVDLDVLRRLGSCSILHYSLPANIGSQCRHVTLLHPKLTGSYSVTEATVAQPIPRATVSSTPPASVHAAGVRRVPPRRCRGLAASSSARG